MRRAVALGGVALGLSGCAVGGYGALATRYTYTPSALVVDVYSIGVDVRPQALDAGASAGYRHSSYVFFRPALEAERPSSGWRWFSAPLPRTDPLLQASTVVGVDVRATSAIARFAVGYVDQVITIGPRADESRIVEISYDRRDPARAHVRSQEGTHDLSPSR